MRLPILIAFLFLAGMTGLPRVQALAGPQDAHTSDAKPGEKPADKPADKPAPPPSAAAARVTIEVAGGENNQPVENASVYLKYVEERKLKKNKTTELNVKTNREGTAHVPDTPLGRVLIQIVADGWKTYGRWYDISDANQTIKVHLEKPPKWY